MVKLWNVLDWPSHLPDLNPTDGVFRLLRTRPKGKKSSRNKEKVKMAAVQASINSEDTEGVDVCWNAAFRQSLSAKDLILNIKNCDFI